MSLLAGITRALTASDEQERARRLSAALAGVVPHRALAMLDRGCARSPVSAAGEHGIADRITIGDFAQLENSIVAPGIWQGEAQAAGETRPVVVAEHGGTRSILLMVRSEATPVGPEELTTLTEAWSLFAVATRRTLDGATPNDLYVSRAAAGERARVAAELANSYCVALSGVLSALRARHLDDRAARQTAIDVAASALIELRTSADRERELGDEPPAEAFRRLRKELEPTVRFSTAHLEFVAPSGGGALPGTVAGVARAISRGVVLRLLEQPDVHRLRVAWALEDGLEVSVRDDGPGDESSVIDGALTELARAVGGSVRAESVPGWGTHVLARLPLEDATGVNATANDPLAALRPRELEVLAELAKGRRNREIAETLSISENTVKFHVANVLDKLGVSSRNEAAFVARDAGMAATPTLHEV